MYQDCVLYTIWGPTLCALSECTRTVFCTQYGIPQCAHCLNVPGMCFHIWPDDGSLETKYVAEFVILISLYTLLCCVVDWTKLFYSCFECNSFFKNLVILYFLIEKGNYSHRGQRAGTAAVCV